MLADVLVLAEAKSSPSNWKQHKGGAARDEICPECVCVRGMTHASALCIGEAYDALCRPHAALSRVIVSCSCEQLRTGTLRELLSTAGQPGLHQALFAV